MVIKDVPPERDCCCAKRWIYNMCEYCCIKCQAIKWVKSQDFLDSLRNKHGFVPEHHIYNATYIILLT